MKKSRKNIDRIEWALVIILIVCTLFQFTANRYITALLTSIIAVIISLYIKTKRTVQPNKKKALQVIFLFAILYIALFYMVGLYTGYISSSIKFGLKTIIDYILPISIIIASGEILRDRLLLDTSNQSKILIVVIGTLIDLSIYRNIYNTSNLEGFLAFVGIICITSFVNNLLYTYLSSRYGMKPVLIYKFITILYAYFIPFTPNVYTYFRIFARMFYPLLMFLYIDKYFDMNRYHESNRANRNQIISIAVTAASIILVIGLISCQFTYGMLVIGSSSMTGSVNKGDAVFFKNEKKNISEGDIIVFKRDKIRVVHRVVAVKNINNEIRYYTKGDTNTLMDDEYVTNETLLGKVLFRIKYIGKPSLWLRNKFE